MYRIFVLLVSFSCFACPGSSGDSSIVSQVDIQDTAMEEAIPRAAYFKGHGYNPSWKLAIYEDNIAFESAISGFESIVLPHVEPERDQGKKVYVGSVDNMKFRIEIAHENCSIESSNESFMYSLSVIFDLNETADPQLFTGCGRYVTDMRLEGKWVLTAIRDSVIVQDDSTNLTMLELAPDGNSFFGFAGCNKIQGRLFSERTLLRFTDVTSTRMTCPLQSLEDNFLEALGFSTQYKLEEDKLILSNPASQTLSFRKNP